MARLAHSGHSWRLCLGAAVQDAGGALVQDRLAASPAQAPAWRIMHNNNNNNNDNDNNTTNICVC